MRYGWTESFNPPPVPSPGTSEPPPDEAALPPQVEPTSEQFLAALAAWDAVCADLDVTWEARQPIHGEATPKVFAYRLAKAALNAATLPKCAACGRPVPGEGCQRPDCLGYKQAEPRPEAGDERG